MKTNIVLFWVVAIYFFVVAAVYVVWNLIVHGYVEWAGGTALVLSGALGAFIASYLMLVKRKQGGVLVEDRQDSDVADGDAEQGEFSPWSWWPIVLAFVLALFFMGIALSGNFWLAFMTLPFIPVAMVGWVYEYYRGYFAR